MPPADRDDYARRAAHEFLASISLPCPVEDKMGDESVTCDSDCTVTQALIACVRSEARAEALEEAARELDASPEWANAKVFAARIRALKGVNPTPSGQ